MKVSIASDHAGFSYKSVIVKELHEQGFDILDLGTFNEMPTDYPDHAKDIALSILKGETERGILICGSGVGVAVAANKFKGIRAGVCHDTYSAHQCVEHDDVNVLCIGQRVIGIELAREIITSFLGAQFSKASRHQKRLDKILDIENGNMKEINYKF